MCAAAALLAGLNELAANFLRHYPQYKKGAFNLTELARLCGISRTTAYKYIGLLEE
jgi:response regulator of citrate/malate metabolism